LAPEAGPQALPPALPRFKTGPMMSRRARRKFARLHAVVSRVRIDRFQPWFPRIPGSSAPNETGVWLRIRRTAWEEQAEAHHVLTFLEQLEDIGANPLPSHMLKTLVGRKRSKP
jgi:hypothetical protein